MPQVLEIFSCGRQTCWTDLTYPIPRLLISYQCKESELSVFRRENVMGHAVWPCTLTPNLLKCHAWQYCCTWLSHNCMINWYRSAADTMAYIWMALDHQQTLLYWQNTGQEHMILVFVITFWIFFYDFPLFSLLSRMREQGVQFMSRLWPCNSLSWLKAMGTATAQHIWCVHTTSGWCMYVNFSELLRE